jgi:hypothetical protein
MQAEGKRTVAVELYYPQGLPQQVSITVAKQFEELFILSSSTESE